MISVSRPLVSFAALLLAGSAALGLYLGYSRANSTPGGGANDLTPTPASVAAKTASPIPDAAPPPVPDEAFIRKIAHEEAMAALHPKHVAAPADDADDSGDDSDISSDADAHAPPPGPLIAPPPSAVPSAQQ